MKYFDFVIKNFKKQSLICFVGVMSLYACSSSKPVAPEPHDPIGDILHAQGSITNATQPHESMSVTMLRVPATATQVPFEHHQAVEVAQISRWGSDQSITAQTWVALQRSCQKIAKMPAWQSVCGFARQYPTLNAEEIRIFFEQNFNAFVLKNSQGQDGLMTGYYEPIIDGSTSRQGQYQYPLYAMPANWKRSSSLPSTQEILQGDLLRGHELVYLADPVEGAFIHIQGSAKIRLTDGKLMQIAYAGNNGKPFASMAKWLINNGQISAAQASMQGIKTWAKNNPNKINELLSSNPRFIFFSANLIATDQSIGPIGSLGVPLSSEHSVAVDKSMIPLGTPMFVDTLHPQQHTPFSRLVMAQDTGAAIKGAARIDFFWGSGEQAGEVAGITKQTAQLWALWPK